MKDIYGYYKKILYDPFFLKIASTLLENEYNNHVIIKWKAVLGKL